MSFNVPQFFLLFVLVFVFPFLDGQQQEGNITHTTTTLSQARFRFASTSSGELVFFAGGNNSTGASDQVDIYNVTSENWTRRRTAEAGLVFIWDHLRK
jgi:hypothetical protein